MYREAGQPCVVTRWNLSSPPSCSWVRAEVVYFPYFVHCCMPVSPAGLSSWPCHMPCTFPTSVHFRSPSISASRVPALLDPHAGRLGLNGTSYKERLSHRFQNDYHIDFITFSLFTQLSCCSTALVISYYFYVLCI